MAITNYVDFVNNYLTKNGMIGNASNINKAPDQLKLEVDELNQGISTLGNTAVKLTGDQTIAGVKTFSSNIVGNVTGNITGNSATTTKLQTARTITMSGDVTGSVSFDGSANVSITATVADNSHNHTDLSGTVSFSGSTGNAYNNSNIEVRGNGPANTIKAGIGFHQPGLYAGTLSMLDGNTFQFSNQSGQPATLNNHITGSAGSATTANTLSIGGTSSTFHWSGQGGQPTWLYGGNDPSNTYVYNPANFSVNYATSATYAATAAVGTNNTQIATTAFVHSVVAGSGATGFTQSLAANGYQKLPSGLIIQWGTYSGASGGTVTFPLAFPSSCASVVITGMGTGLTTLNNSTPTKTSFYWHDAGYAEGRGIKWIAIGY